MKKIFIGADSAGFTLKEELKAHLRELGYEVFDMGTSSAASCHYPLFASAVCKGVLEDGNAFGVLVCGTGIGMSMCANKYHGIRAAVCSDTYSAKMTRAHNDANVICLGARVIGSCLAIIGLTIVIASIVALNLIKPKEKNNLGTKIYEEKRDW